MALANFTMASAAAVPPLAPTASAPLRVGLDDLLYTPEQAENPPQPGSEPYAPPVNRRSKLRKRAGAAYLPPPNQYTHYPHADIPRNPYNGQLHTQVYQQRLDVQIDNQRVQASPQYDNNGQYVHDPSGDYDYEQRRLNTAPRPYGFAEAPYPAATTPPSSRKFEGSNANNQVNSFGFANRASPPTVAPPRPSVKAGGGGSSGAPPDRPRGFTKVEQGSPGAGGKTQLHAVLDYDDEDYYDDVPGPDSGQPAITPLQGPILLRNGTVPVVPLTSYPTVNNGSFYQIPILWTALSLALGYELQGQIIRGVPCVKRNYQLYCPTAGNTYPLDKIENFIDENKALIKRMYGSFTTPGGNRVRRAPGVPDMHTGDSYFRHTRQAANTPLPDAQAVNSTGSGDRVRRPLAVPDMHTGDSYFHHRRQAANTPLPDAQAVNSTGRIDACESKTEIMTPYWALNSARKLRAIVNTMHFEQAIHQEVCSKKTTGRCSGDCGCEQKYKWHRLLAYDPSDDCAGIFMDWFLFPSCCVCRCNP